MRKTVRAIQGQIIAEGALHEAEIIISDNTDIAEKKVDASQFKEKNMRHISNTGNIGFARSVNKLILEAKGEYVWLLSDDDIVLDSAIKSILDYLKNQQDSHINYLTFYSGAGWERKRDYNLYFKNCARHYFVNGSDFLEKYWLNTVFISVNIFHREKMISHAEKNNLFSMFNDTYHHALLIISFIDRFGACQIMPETLLFDSSPPKLYTSYNSVSVPVSDYTKLFTQLKSLGINKKCLAGIEKEINRSILSSGLELAVRKIEIDDEFDYAVAYEKVIKQRELPVSTRAKAGFIWLLFKFPKKISRVAVRALYAAEGKKQRYEAVRRESLQWHEDIQKNKITNWF